MRWPIERLRRSIQTGISYALPVLVVGGLCSGALPWCGPALEPLLRQIAALCGALAPVIFAAYTAYAAVGRPALIPALAVGALAHSAGLGAPGALAGALLSAVVIAVMRELEFPRDMKNIKTMLLLPCLATLLPAAVLQYAAPLFARFEQILQQGESGLCLPVRALVGAVLAGLLSLDMGGEKGNFSSLAANLLLLEGWAWPTAAKVAGCIVPGLVLAGYLLCCGQGFQKRLAVQACCQITEGVLPYLRRGPQGLVPACMAGAGTAGALAVWGGVQCCVPHGGLFLLPFMQYPGRFLLAILAGSLLGIMLLFLFQRLPPGVWTPKKEPEFPVEWINF